MEMETVLRLLGHFEDVARVSLDLERLGEVVLDELHQGPPIEEQDHFRFLPLLLLLLKEDLLVVEEPFEHQHQHQQPHRYHSGRVPALGRVVEKEDLLCPSSAGGQLVRWCGRQAGWSMVFLCWLVSELR